MSTGMSANRPTADYESAVAVTTGLIDAARHSADYNWPGGWEQVVDCYYSTDPMEAAAERVGAAYKALAEALEEFRAAAKRALDQETERTRH